MHDPITEQLARIADALDAAAHDKSLLMLFQILERQLEKIMASLDKLTAEVEKLKVVEDSAVALINGLSQQIKDAGVDQAKLDALTDQLDSNAQGLAAAITANTPAAPVVFPVEPLPQPAS